MCGLKDRVVLWILKVDPRKIQLENMEDEFVGNLRIGGVINAVVFCIYSFNTGYKGHWRKSSLAVSFRSPFHDFLMSFHWQQHKVSGMPIPP